MATQVQGPANKLELAALGRPAQTDDWVRDTRIRLGLLFMGPTQPDLIKLLAERLKIRSAYARPGLDAILIALENRPEGFLTEVKKVRDMLDLSSTTDFFGGGHIAEIFYRHLEVEADEILFQQAQIVEEWNDFQNYLETKNEAVANIPRSLRAVCRESGHDRVELAKEMKNVFLSLFNSHQDLPPIVQLTYAWICMQISETTDEVLVVLASATRSLTPSTSSHLCCRLLSDLYQREGQLTRAMDWSKRAIEQRNCAEANIDMALLASEMHEPSAAKPYVEEALMRRAASLMSLLSDDRCVGLGTDLLDVLVRIQMRMRREGRQFISNWATAAKEIIDIQRNFGTELMISHELLEAHKMIPNRLAEADILTASYLIRYCQDCTTELKEAAKASLERDFDRKREALTAARMAIDSVGTARETRVSAAKRENEERIKQTYALVANAAAKSKNVERQSLVCFGSGCALFVLYIVTKFVMRLSGSLTDISSGLGLFFMIVAAIPIALSIALQIFHGLGLAAAEISIREKVADANKKLSQAELEADDLHRDQIAAARKNLIDSENSLRRIETALKTMRGEVYEPEMTSPRLRTA